METNELRKNASKKTLENSVLSAKPKDYADRNNLYRLASEFLGWVFQTASICAGAYLLFDIILQIFEVQNVYIQYAVVFGCLGVFMLIEMLRRWLINTTGYHYLATFNIENGILKSGVFLRTKVVFITLVSIVMITTGVSGMYQFVFDVSPKAKTKDVTKTVKPITDNLTQQLSSVKESEKIIHNLSAQKNSIINNPANYNTWKGVAYITPTANESVKALESQISEALKAKQKTLDLVGKTQERQSVIEDKTHSENDIIKASNLQDKTFLALTSAVIWLIFEILLVLCISYNWVYKYNVKCELLLLKKKPFVEYEKEPVVTKSVFNLRNIKRHNIKTDKVQTSQTVTAKTQETPFSVAGFEYGKSVVTKPVIEHAVTKEPETIVVIDNEKSVEQNGYNFTCLTCGKKSVAKRPAKFCPDTKDESGKKITSKCRNTWWHDESFTREEKLKRWVKNGYNKDDFKG